MKRKNIYYLLLTLALLLSGGGMASAQTFNRGDVNGDGLVDITDVTVLVNYLHSGQFNLVARTVSFAENTTTVNKTYGDAAFTKTATPSAGTSDGTLTYSSSTETVATVNATTGEVTIVGAGETIITATISAGTIYAEASASYTLTVAKATNIALTTVLPTAPTESTGDKTYTGNPIQLIQAGTTIAGAGTVKYKVTTENIQPSTDEDGWAENIPTATDAGPHYVWYYVAGNENHNETAVCTEPITVTIAMDNSTIDNPATLMSTPPTEITGLTFSGSEIELINAGEKKPGAGTVMYLVTDTETPAPVSTTGDWSASIPKRTNAGDYYVWYYIAASNSHAKTGVCSTPITVTIAKATITDPASLMTTEPTAKMDGENNQKYTGSAINLIIEGITKAGAGTVMYKATTENMKPNTTDADWVVGTNLTETNAGTYYVWYYVDGNNNHDATEVCESAIAVTIDKATITDPATLMTTAPTANKDGENNQKYTGSAINLIIEGSTKAGAGTVMYKVTNSDTKPTIDNSWSDEIPTATNAGDYYVWYYVDGNENHNATAVCETPITVTIAKDNSTIDNPATLMSTPPTEITGLTFSGSAINLIDAGEKKPGAGTVMYLVTNAATPVPNANEGNWSASIPTATEAGPHYVWYYVDGNDNHNATAVCSTPIEVNIAKDNSTIDNPATLMSTPPTEITGLTFSGSEIQLINAGEKKTGAGTVMYLVTDAETPAPVSTTGDWSESIPTKTNVGKYYVWYYIDGNGNHEKTAVCESAIEVNIDKATSITNPASLMTTPPTANKDGENNQKYTGSAINLIIEGITKAGAGTVMYKATTENMKPNTTDADWVVGTNLTETNAGTYYVWYYVDGNNNHDATEVCESAIAVTIDKATITDPATLMTTAPTAKKNGENNQTYDSGNAITLINEGTKAAGAGTVMYKVTTENSTPDIDNSWSDGIPTATNAGTYYVWYYVAGNENYEKTEVCSTPIEVTIDHATPSLTITSATELALDNTTNTGTITVDRSGDGEVTAESSDTGVATVNVDGTTITVTAVASGTATITIKMNQGTNYAAYTGTDQTVNVTVTMNLTSVTSTAVGKLIGADGNVYATATAATYAGTSAIAMIVYVGEAGTADASSATYKGLAIALTDASTSAGAAWYGTGSSHSSTCVYQNSTFSNHYGYADINGIANTNQMADKTGTCSGHTHAAATAAKNYSVAVPANCSQWFLPTSGQWLKFFRNSTLNLTWSDWGYSSGGDSDYNKVNKMFTDAGANSAVFSANAGYWSSSEFDTNQAVGVGFMSSGGIVVVDLYKSEACRVRAFLAF